MLLWCVKVFVVCVQYLTGLATPPLGTYQLTSSSRGKEGRFCKLILLCSGNRFNKFSTNLCTGSRFLKIFFLFFALVTGFTSFQLFPLVTSFIFSTTLYFVLVTGFTCFRFLEFDLVTGFTIFNHTLLWL